MSLNLRLSVRSLRDVRLRVRYVPEERTLPIRRPGVVLAVLLVVWAALLVSPVGPIDMPGFERAVAVQPVVGPVTPTPELPHPWPQSVALSAARAVDARFTPGSTLGATMRRAGASGATLTEFLSVASAAINVRRIRPGQAYQLYYDANDELVGFRYQVDRQQAWFIALEDGAWRAMKVSLPIESRTVFVSAEISDSLYRALRVHAPTNGATSDLLSKVGNIYAWDVDFQHDLQYGDRLDLLVEERFVEGKFIGYGEIVAAEFAVNGRTLPVVRYRDNNGSASYFTPRGESLRRTFLRSPVGDVRVSSRFSYRRVHPVTGVARPHRGVDYAASPGTPVKATADGVVVEATYGAEPGRYVKLRHGGSYSSVYMHLSRIAEGMKPGREVKQGDVIGYVGKTGNTTGYHLHYGLIQGTQYVDPLQLQFPSAAPIPRAHWASFENQRDEALNALRAGQASRGAAVAGGL